MASPDGSFESRKRDEKESEAEGSKIFRPAADLVVRFTGKEFVPSDETPLGAALVGNLAKRSETGPYRVPFAEPYLVELCIGAGRGFTDAPLVVKGFVLGPSPSGVPSLLGLVTLDGKRHRLPVVLVSEQNAEWSLIETPLGWNRDLTAAAPQGKIGGQRVSFNEKGVFLVVLREPNEDVLQMPITIHSVVVTSEGKILKAKSKDGRVFQPKAEELDLRAESLPATPEPPRGEYSLAPVDGALQVPLSGEGRETRMPSKQDVAHAVAESTRTRREARDYQIELALRRLMIRERSRASKGDAELITKTMLASAKNEGKSETALTDACKKLVLMAGGNLRADLFAAHCRRWIDHHQSRTFVKEMIWRDYYEDLTTVAPLLSGLEADLNRADLSGYDKKMEERRKR